MDKIFELNGISFIWDLTKAQKNVNSHDIIFEQAAETFFDPFLQVIDASPEEEVRDAVIAMDTHWSLLVVVHILVDNELIRIISARKATRSERRIYEN